MGPCAKAVFITDLEQFCRAALCGCGMSDEHARLATDVLVTTDTFGVCTHGTKNLRGYVRRLRAGGLRADARPRIEDKGPGLAVVDGQSALGMVPAVLAMNMAIRKARSTGVAYVGVRNSCHFGAAGYYALLAARADMIGLAMANDTPSMAVPGSRAGVLGTNPLAWAVPAGEEDPVFLDIASSAVAGGKVRIVQALGQRTPENWLVDSEGLPTTDPFLYPRAASLLPFAGHKGYGIAMMIETLAGVLSGAGVMGEVLSWIDGDPAQPTGHGAAFVAIDPGAMMPIDQFKRRVDKMVRDIRQAPKAKGSDRIFVPGEKEWEHRRRSLAAGIPMPSDALASLRALAEELDLKANWLDNATR